MPSGLIAFEGVEHGTSSRGKAIRLFRNKNDHWVTEPIVTFGEAPQAVFKDGHDTVIVATSKRLLRVSPATKKMDILLDKAFWNGLYPNSIVVTPSGTIFVGMRHGIAKVEKKDAYYKTVWLLPTKKFADATFSDGFR